MNYINGNAGRNTLRGTDARDTIEGKGGDDALFGGGGSDVIRGQLGVDRLYGNGGDDFLSGGEDRDVLFGMDGRDHLWGDGGDDLIHGGKGNDDLYGGDGDDNLKGNDGDDRLFGDFGIDRLDGGGGNDQLFASSGDRLLGGGGDDVIHSAEGSSAGPMLLDGGAGRDTFSYGFTPNGPTDSPYGSFYRANDMITDFQSGQDKLSLRYDWYSEVDADLEEHDVLTFAELDTNRDGVFGLGDEAALIGEASFFAVPGDSLTINLDAANFAGGKITLYGVTELTSADIVG